MGQVEIGRTVTGVKSASTLAGRSASTVSSDEVAVCGDVVCGVVICDGAHFRCHSFLQSAHCIIEILIVYGEKTWRVYIVLTVTFHHLRPWPFLTGAASFTLDRQLSKRFRLPDVVFVIRGDVLHNRW